MAGRPLKFQTVDELDAACKEYFDDCEKTGEPPIGTGLAVHLETSRDTLRDYREGVYDTENAQFSATISKYWTIIEKYGETRLIKRGNSGDIFWMKNHGFSDKQDVDLHVDGQISVLDAFNAMKNR